MEARARGLLPFQDSPIYNRLVEKIGTADYVKLDAQTRLLLGYYLQSKRLHEDAQRMRAGL